MGNYAVLIALSAFLLGCGSSPRPPKRPAGVPVNAVWAGGVDGGSFIFCDIDRGWDVNTCSVYNDYTGEIMERGDFRLKAESRAARAEELKYAWANWGGSIGLSDGRFLVRVYLPTR